VEAMVAVIITIIIIATTPRTILFTNIIRTTEKIIDEITTKMEVKALVIIIVTIIDVG